MLDSYNFDHEQVSFLEGARLFSDPRRRIGLDEVNGKTISTVFLVVDHRHHGDPLPVLYETRVTDEDNEPLWADRYRTREAALAGHDRTVAWVRNPTVDAPRRPVPLPHQP